MFGILSHGEQRVEGNTQCYLNKMGIDGLSGRRFVYCQCNVAHIFYMDLKHGNTEVICFFRIMLSSLLTFFGSEIQLTLPIM